MILYILKKVIKMNELILSAALGIGSIVLGVGLYSAIESCRHAPKWRNAAR